MGPTDTRTNRAASRLAGAAASTAGLIYKHFVSTFPQPQEGALRVYWIPQIPGEPFEWPVADLTQAALMLDALAAYDDFQFAQNVKGDYSNTGGLLIFRDGDWEDWESEDCDDFDTYRANLADVGDRTAPAKTETGA